MQQEEHQFVCLHLIGDDGALTDSSTLMEFINHYVAGVHPDEQQTTIITSKTNGPNTSPHLNNTPVTFDNAAPSIVDKPLLGPEVLADKYIKTSIGLKYHVVGVFGGQSSGKSTLLNHVFGTKFKTMDAEKGRQQTTKGAFLAICDSDNMDMSPLDSYELQRKKKPLLVVDFEGTDGAERGEDQSFERQLSLFALSIADTLIINMWTVEVGRFNAANLSLLRTVFEVNMQLFSHSANLDQEKPTLLFVMRDHTVKDITKNAEKVRTSIDNIWDTIHKPAGLEGCNIDRLFNVQFFGFPHYELQRNEFMSCVNDFRRLFVNDGDNTSNSQMTPSSNSFIEGNTTHSVFVSPLTFRGVPLESLPQYLSSCWASIQKSKDLDIPSQREMISRLRCKELADEKITVYQNMSEEYISRMESYEELVPDLQSIIKEEYQKLLNDYVTEAELYTPCVVDAEKVRLCREMDVLYEATIKVQIKLIVDDVLRNMDTDIHILVDNTVKDVIWQNGKILRTTELPLAVVNDPSSVGAHELDITGAEVNVIVTEFWEKLANGVVRLCESAKDTGKVQELFGRWRDIIMADSTLREMVFSQLTVAVTLCIRKRLEGLTNDISISMHKTFEYVINHKSDGSILSFSSTEKLQRQYRPARFAGLVLAACLVYYRLKLTSTITKDNMTHYSVCFKDNEDERLFYLTLGTAHMSPDMATDTAHGVRYPTANIRPHRPTAVNNGIICDNADILIDNDINNSGVSAGRVLITKGALKRSLELYFQQINFAFSVQFKNVEASNSGSSVPIWIWLLLLYCGYDDIIRLFYSPVYLAMIVVLATVFFSKLIAEKWREFEETGPPMVVQIIRYLIVCAKPYLDIIREQTKPMIDGGHDSTPNNDNNNNNNNNNN